MPVSRARVISGALARDAATACAVRWPARLMMVMMLAASQRGARDLRFQSGGRRRPWSSFLFSRVPPIRVWPSFQALVGGPCPGDRDLAWTWAACLMLRPSLRTYCSTCLPLSRALSACLPGLPPGYLRRETCRPGRQAGMYVCMQCTHSAGVWTCTPVIRNGSEGKKKGEENTEYNRQRQPQGGGLAQSARASI